MKYTQVYFYIVIGVFVEEKLLNAHESTGITWSEASEFCGEDGLEYEEDLLQKVNISDREYFWVGFAIYRIKSPWIEILGCYQNTESGDVTKSQSIVTCQNRCRNSSFFGYMEATNSCVCLLNSFNTSGFTNISYCTQNSANYFFVYHVYDSFIPESQHNCATIYCLNNANNINPRDCNETSSLIDGKCDTIASNTEHQWGKPYAVCKNYCMRFNKLLSPSTYCERKGNENSATNLWTNVFREELNTKLTKNEAIKYDVNERVGCVYGTKQTNGGSGSKLITNRTHCDVSLGWFICKNHTEAFSADALTPMTSTQSLHTGSSIDSEASSADTISPLTSTQGLHTSSSRDSNASTADAISPLTSTQSLHTSSSRDKEDQTIVHENLKNHSAEQSPLVGGIVGGVFGFIVIFVVGISLFLCHKRSIGLFKKQTCEMKQKDDFSRAIYESNDQSYSNEDERSKCNRSYGLVDINTHSNYAQVANKIENKPVAVDDTYTDTSCGEYDMLNNVENRKIRQNENLYDSNAGIRDTADPTYDTSTNARIVHDGINIYDHTQNVNIESDYDSSSSVSAVRIDPNGVYDKVF